MADARLEFLSGLPTWPNAETCFMDRPDPPVSKSSSFCRWNRGPQRLGLAAMTGLPNFVAPIGSDSTPASKSDMRTVFVLEPLLAFSAGVRTSFARAPGT